MIKGFKKYSYPIIKYGDSIKIDSAIIVNDIREELINGLEKNKSKGVTLEDIKNNIKQSEIEEQKYIDKCLEMSDLWYEQAAKTNILKLEKEYLEALERFNNYKIKAGFNTWYENAQGTCAIIYEIKNKTYGMYIRLYEDRDYKTDEIKKYEVSYKLYTNSDFIRNGSQLTIANAKRICKNKKEAEKYIEGRKKFFGKYFQEECPPVLKKYEIAFRINGVTLEPYTIIDQL